MISTHSLNLLPPEDRVYVGHQRLVRFFIVFFTVIAFFLLIGNVLLLPTYFFLYFQNRGVAELVAVQKQTAESPEANTIEARIKTANDELRRLEMEYDLTQSSLATYVESVVSMAPDGIMLTSFSYEKDTHQILLRGNANTRGDLLQYLSAIQSHALFQNVESPVENILQEKNILFSLSFTTGEKTIKP